MLGVVHVDHIHTLIQGHPEHNNTEQLHSLIERVQERRERFLQQRRDLDEMLEGLDEVQTLCERALANAGQT